MSEYIEEAARRIFGENNPEMRPQRPFYCADKLLGGVRIKFDLFDQKKTPNHPNDDRKTQNLWEYFNYQGSGILVSFQEISGVIRATTLMSHAGGCHRANFDTPNCLPVKCYY